MKQAYGIAGCKLAKIGILVGLLAISCQIAFAQSAGVPSYCGTEYSTKATSLNSAAEHAVSVSSPDKQKIVIARTIWDEGTSDDDYVSYSVRVARKTFRTKLPGFNGEVTWSPDSKAFAVSETEGGGGIGARVYVFFVDADGLHKMDVSEPIEKDFGYPVRCEAKIPPNTGVVSWGSDSSTLYVAAQVIRVSLCKCMGAFRVYEVNLPTLAILRVYSQTESKKRFKAFLGCDLRDIDDSCVEKLEKHFRKADEISPNVREEGTLR
jgi:hypothetical protein